MLLFVGSLDPLSSTGGKEGRMEGRKEGRGEREREREREKEEREAGKKEGRKVIIARGELDDKYIHIRMNLKRIHFQTRLGHQAALGGGGSTATQGRGIQLC